MSEGGAREFLGQPLDTQAVLASLGTKWVGRRLHHLPETGSTNDVARELARAGAPAGTLVVAERQTRGRGRLGRRWESPASLNLYLSLVLRPPLEADRPTQIPLVAGLATCEALRRWTSAMLKWPNDVLIAGRKAAGILAEAETGGSKPPALVLGIGVNVNAGGEDFPPELRTTATSLRIAVGHPLDRAQVLVAVLDQLERWYERWARDGFAPLVPEWCARTAMLGRKVRVTAAAEVLEGVAVGLDESGALRLRDRHGREVAVRAGDVALVRDAMRGNAEAGGEP